MEHHSKQMRNSLIHSIWITWEHQRRSIILAQEFSAKYYELISKKSRIFRYLTLSIKTLKLIKAENPDILFVQSPSIILAAVTALYRRMFKNIVLVVDRHTNFYPLTNFRFFDFFLQFLGNFTLKNCDLTLVTNNSLRKVVENRKGSCDVLQDKLPRLLHKSEYVPDGKFNILYPCSFSVDEPIIEVIESAKLIRNDIHIYITGKYENYKALKGAIIPENVHLIGFVSDQNYIDYMYSVDAVLALTTWENNILCCAYEAVSLSKPIILSNKKELCNYFYKGRVICDNSAESIATAIKDMISGYTSYAREIIELKKELLNAWNVRFSEVKNSICRLIDQR